jgi:peptide/nickel transport system permease protein
VIRRIAVRVVQGLVVLPLVAFASFVLADLAPGDFFAEMRLDPRMSQESLRVLRERHGLDRPLPERYARWLRSMARGEMGFSFAYGQPVGPLLWPRARNSLVLNAVATAIAWALAIPTGVGWVRLRARPARHAVAAATALFLSLPDVVVALALLLIAVRTGWFPAGGMVSIGHDDMAWPARVRDLARHLALPATALVIGILPVLVRHVRAAVSAALDAPFVRVARAHGLSEGRILFRHALPAAANPLVSLFGLSLASLLSMSLLVEVVMGWPGLGPLMLEAILARDLHLVVAPVLASTTFLLLGNLAGDLLLLAVDPRIRSGAR